MNKNILVAAGGAALIIGLIALPGPSKTNQEREMVAPRVQLAPGMPDDERELNIVTSFADEGGSWLGVETQEVTAEKAKEAKLPAERGAVIGKVLEDSPAAKAGLKDGDVVTAINGEAVEGTLQFRRMIREIPAGRSVQLTVWRDGRSQNINATLDKMQEGRRHLMKAAPQVFKFRMPEMPEVAPMPGMPDLEWNEGMLMPGKPRLGIDAEDISGHRHRAGGEGLADHVASGVDDEAATVGARIAGADHVGALLVRANRAGRSIPCPLKQPRSWRAGTSGRNADAWPGCRTVSSRRSRLSAPALERASSRGRPGQRGRSSSRFDRSERN